MPMLRPSSRPKFALWLGLGSDYMRGYISQHANNARLLILLVACASAIAFIMQHA